MVVALKNMHMQKEGGETEDHSEQAKNTMQRIHKVLSRQDKKLTYSRKQLDPKNLIN